MNLNRALSEITLCICNHKRTKHWSRIGATQIPRPDSDIQGCSMCDCPQFSLPPKADWLPRLLTWAKIAALLSLAVSLLIITSAVTDVAQKTNQTLEQTNQVLKRTEATVTDARRVILSIGGTAAEMRAAAKEQRRQALETTRQVTLLVTDLRETVNRVNNESLPALNRAIAENSADIGRVTEEAALLIRHTDEQLTPLLASTKVVVDNANESAVKLSATMDTAGSTMKHVDGTTANVEAMSKDTREMVHRLTRPARSTWEVLKGIGRWFLAGMTAFR